MQTNVEGQTLTAGCLGGKGVQGRGRADKAAVGVVWVFAHGLGCYDGPTAVCVCQKSSDPASSLCIVSIFFFLQRRGRGW